MGLDAVGVVGDLEAAHVDVARVGQVEDEPRAAAAPQLGRIATAGIPAFAQETGWMFGVRAAGDRRHGAVERSTLLAVVRARRAVSHLIGAGGDEKGLTAGKARIPARRQGPEGMVPSAGLALAVAGIRSVGQARALVIVASVGADVVNRSAQWRDLDGDG